MRAFDIPYLADWVVTALRWLLLLGMTVALAFAGPLSQPNQALLLLAVLWNLFATVLAIVSRRLRWHRPIHLAADSLLSLGFFALNGGSAGPLAWSGALAISSAAIFYEWRGCLLWGLLLTLLQPAWMYSSAPAAFQVQAHLPVAGFNLLVVLVMGFASTNLMQRLRGGYQAGLQARRESERRAALTERSRIQSMYQMVETMSASLNYQVVLNRALDLCTGALGGTESPAGKMISAILLFRGRDLQVAAGRGLSAQDLKQEFPAEKGILHECLQTAGPRQLENPSQDPELGRILTLTGCRSAVVIPLRRGVNAFGVTMFAHPEPDFFNPDHREFLEMISHQAVFAIQNARLYHDLEQEKEHLVKSQEEARKKLARDLHDGPIQSLSAIVMRADVASRLLQTSPSGAAAELGGISEVANRTTHELRHMLFTLRPLALESEGLVPALQAMAGKMNETFQQNVQLDIEQAVVDELELNRQSAVFYLVEEAVNNARKHASASVIQVNLKSFPNIPGVAALEILDNGVGFDVKDVLGSYDTRGSLGMINLQERAELASGLLSIDSQPGKGTLVRVLIPLTEEASHRLQDGQ